MGMSIRRLMTTILRFVWLNAPAVDRVQQLLATVVVYIYFGRRGCFGLAGTLLLYLPTERVSIVD
jgi:hypothetical protein